MYEYFVFDLDGTISDPKVGVVRSINFSLESHGYDVRPESHITPFIGPPLDVAFSTLAETEDKALIDSLVAKYRERYAEVGYAENSLYDGVVDAIEALSACSDIQLGICTSKHVVFAERILELFSLRQYFSFVSGGDVGVEKTQQLAALLAHGKINQNAVMIGDRDVDLIAAHKNKLSAAGVLWGYGSRAELSAYQPAHLLGGVGELVGLAM